MKKVSLMLKPLNLNIIRKRTLFHESYIGLDRFKRTKAIESQSSALQKIFQKCSENPGSKILSHQFKKLVYLVNTEEDLKIFSDILERYAKSESESEGNIKFQIFNAGPEIVRVYHLLNKPVEAFSLVKHPQIFPLICDLTALMILQDLLYENEFYEEVCEIFNIIQEKQFYKRIFHIAPYILYQAACYKMDTPQSYKNAIARLEEYKKYNKRPQWPSLIYTTMFALKNCSLDIPIEYASASDSASVNIRMSALIKSRNYSDALSLWNTVENKSILSKSVAEDISKSLENLETIPDKSLIKQLQEFKQEIGEKTLIDKTLDEMAHDVILSLTPNKNRHQIK